jgi:hypothetical protein
MSDLVERLRSVEFADVPQKYLMLEAANELERIAVERLQEMGEKTALLLESAAEIERLRLNVFGLTVDNGAKGDIIRELHDEIERLRKLEAILRELLEGLREGEGLRERYERRFALLDRGRRALGEAKDE